MNTEDRIAWLQKVERQIRERKEYECLAADATAKLAVEGRHHPYANQSHKWKEEMIYQRIEDAATRCASSGLNKIFNRKTELGLAQMIGALRQLEADCLKVEKNALPLTDIIDINQSLSTVAYLLKAGFLERTSEGNYKLKK